MPSEEGLTDDIFGATSYEAQRPKPKEFLPWHRPRKQYVRHYQWCEHIKALLPNPCPEGETLRYLGLPGVDLLDIRYFHSQICESKNLKLRFLGFNNEAHSANEAQIELNTSLHEVRKLPWIDLQSDVIFADFRDMTQEAHVAWHHVRSLGPYDVVNLDLCDGFADRAPNIMMNTHYDAIGRLLSLQARYPKPWLLFLTTRSGVEHVHPEVRFRFRRKYAANLADCESFRVASREAFSITDIQSLETHSQTGDGFLSVFLVGLCKWFMGLAAGQRPSTKVDVRSVIGYRVDPRSHHDDLISLALRFDPLFGSTEDNLGLVSGTVQTPNECESAAEAVHQIIKREEADVILANDHDIRDQMTASMAGLLESARYNASDYLKWVLKGRGLH